MSETVVVPAVPAVEARCARCGLDRTAHHLVNFADGPFVGAPVLICPAGVFESYLDQAVRVLKHSPPVRV